MKRFAVISGLLLVAATAPAVPPDQVEVSWPNQTVIVSLSGSEQESVEMAELSARARINWQHMGRS
jgi:hypothetical protein